MSFGRQDLGLAVAGGFAICVYFAVPSLQQPVQWLLFAAFGMRVFAVVVEATVRKVIAEELRTLERQSQNASERLTVIDRKVGAVLHDLKYGPPA